MPKILTPDEIKARVDRADLEARTVRELELIEHGMGSLAKIRENNTTMIEQVTELIALTKKTEQRDNELREMIHRLIDRLKG
jgi:hypothetical protein